MKLLDLEPRFIKAAIEGGREVHYDVNSLAEANGVFFLCPKCFQRNGGNVGTHGVLCLFRDKGVPDEVSPGIARWGVSGDGLDNLTLTPSVLLIGGCGWHGFVTDGVIMGC